MRSDVLLLRLICSKCDEKRRQSFPSFGAEVCSPLVYLRDDQSDESREKAGVYFLSNISILPFSFILLVLFKLEKWFH